MQAMDDMALLREYAARNSETAFEELVMRRIGFVYSAALRQVREPLLAEEITQAVFILLAQKAGKISGKGWLLRPRRNEDEDRRRGVAATNLMGWLFKATRFTALAQIRDRAKRSLRAAAIEKELQMQTEFQSAGAGEIWNQISPLLDEALAALGEKDRQAVLLRFFENKSLAEVGSVLGVGEDTARKRVSRALGKLHRYFSRRGISSTTAMIAGEISANSIQAAPAALAKSVTAVAVAKGAAASISTLTLIKGALKLMAWTKAKMAIVSAVIVGMLTYSVIQHHARVKLRDRNQSLQEQVSQVLQLRAQNQNLTNLLAQANNSEALARDRLNKLLRQRVQEQESNKVKVEAPPPKPLASPPQPVSPTSPKSIQLPKSSWADVGFATPEAALRTRGWAILNGDHNVFRQSVYITDDARQFAENAMVQMAEASTDPNELEDIQQVLNNNYGVADAILMPMMAANRNNPYTGYTVLSQQLLSPNEAILEVETDTASMTSETETLNFQRFGNDWKVVINKKTIQKMMQQ
jgi:RNA polymerase sigma factor (sigma-70 family)